MKIVPTVPGGGKEWGHRCWARGFGKGEREADGLQEKEPAGPEVGKGFPCPERREGDPCVEGEGGCFNEAFWLVCGERGAGQSRGYDGLGDSSLLFHRRLWPMRVLILLCVDFPPIWPGVGRCRQVREGTGGFKVTPVVQDVAPFPKRKPLWFSFSFFSPQNRMSTLCFPDLRLESDFSRSRGPGIGNPVRKLTRGPTGFAAAARPASRSLAESSVTFRDASSSPPFPET